MRREIAYIVIFLLSGANVCCQQADSYSFRLIVLDENHAPLAAANVQLLRESKSIKETISDARGMASFQQIPAGNFIFRVSSAGFEPRNTHSYHFPSLNYSDTVQLKTFINSLDEISITGRKSYIQQSRGKTIINVEALPTNVGSTVLEVLEKSPGVTVDQNGNISLKGKSPVLVMIDDKPTYLSPSDLNNLLSSMNSAQVDQIELMPNPPAKYDASGNAGIINIKTKKNNQKGFSGSLTSVAAHGRYPKNSENLNLNYRDGKFNVFLNYNFNYVKYFTDLYALRKYYDTSGKLTSILDQPANFTGNYFNNTIKAGLDYSFSARTVLGLAVGATAIHRSGTNYGNATWLEPSGATDSTIDTKNDNVNSFKNATINVNARHSFSDKQDISADFDALYYRINTAEDFTNQFLAPGGYVEESRGSIPTTIRITSGKVDYSLKVASNTNLQAGVKSSYSATDNLASYQNLVSGAWVEDNTMNNHFLYHENVNAIYGSMDGKYGKADIQAGLRYETTDYHGDQQGNAIQKDSAFSRHYGGLFPSGSISYQADSANNFTLTAGRRIDRPVYQTLNPFYFIINKYTYETGNPYLLPQYSWNFEVDHQYKKLLTTTVSYSVITDYFSQLFLADSAKGALLYSQGNVGHTNVFGLSEALSLSPVDWWRFDFQATYNHKRLVGFNGNNYISGIDQLSLNSSNQFTIAKIYVAEISGFYITRAKQDIQELQYPTGQLALAVSRPVLNKKATLKFTVRDILYTGAFSGFTNFPNATEYFKITRDSRVAALTFTYRFGKTFKNANRSEGSASEEAGRVKDE